MMLMFKRTFLIVLAGLLLFGSGNSAIAGDSEKLDKIDKKVSDILDRVYAPDVDMRVFGTEYLTGQCGRLFLQLLVDGEPVNDASCYGTAYYPNDSLFLDSVLMGYLNGSEGFYRYDLGVPEVDGVYILSPVCYIPSDAWSDDFDGYSKIEAYENITIENGRVVLSVSDGNMSLDSYAHWHLNEDSGTDVSDSSGNNRNGTTQNMEDEDWVAGKLNNCLSFDGTNEYVNCGDIASFARTQAFSVETWFKSNAIVNQDIVGRMKGIAPYTGWTLQYASTGAIYFWLMNSYGLGNYIQIATTGIYGDNNWHHVIATYDGSSSSLGMHLYVDGDDVTGSSAGTLTAPILNSEICSIGSRGGSAIYFKGNIDEVVIYDKKLTQAEVAFRYNNATGRESMGDGYNATFGYVQSEPVNLSGEYWHDFVSDYDLVDGNVAFRVLDKDNITLCEGLGDISSCANVTSPVKLYFNISRHDEGLGSPEVDNWYVRWVNESIQEFKGGGEMHVSEDVSGCHINVLGTDYDVSEGRGTVAVQLLHDSLYITRALCNISILYPNKTLWVNSKNMSKLYYKGIWYYDFYFPDDFSLAGVFPAAVFCRYDSGGLIDDTMNDTEPYDYCITDECKRWMRTVADVHIGNSTREVNVSMDDIRENLGDMKNVVFSGYMRPVDYECVDNDTLFVNSSYTMCADGVCKTYYKSEYDVCRYGCNFNFNRCYPSTWVRLLLTGAVGVGIMALIKLLMVVFL